MKHIVKGCDLTWSKLSMILLRHLTIFQFNTITTDWLIDWNYFFIMFCHFTFSQRDSFILRRYLAITWRNLFILFCHLNINLLLCNCYIIIILLYHKDTRYTIKTSFINEQLFHTILPSHYITMSCPYLIMVNLYTIQSSRI